MSQCDWVQFNQDKRLLLNIRLTDGWFKNFSININRITFPK